MSDGVRVTHYKVVRKARKEGGVIVLQDYGGAQRDITVNNPAAPAARILTLGTEPDLTFEPVRERLCSGDWRPVGWIRTE